MCLWIVKNLKQPHFFLFYCLQLSVDYFVFLTSVFLWFSFISIQSGIQGPDHPNPGREYYAVGFPRVAYLPDSQKGRKVLRLLHEAWRRRLVFTVSRSHTTGCEDVVSWNLPHKTDIGPGPNG